MFFGKRDHDRDVRISESQYKSLVGGMSKSERKDFERKQRQFRDERESDRIDAFLDFLEDTD